MRATWRTRVEEWFGLDDDWVRPSPPVGRRDLLLVGAVAVFSLVHLELLRVLDALEGTRGAWWTQWLVVVSGVALLAFRRRWPLAVATLAATHMFVVGMVMPQVMAQLSLQVVYFVAFFAGVAWARDRRVMLLVVGAIVAFMFAWIAWQLAFGGGLEQLLDEEKATALLSPSVAAALLTLLVNAVYFGGAVLAGGHSWRTARQRARLEDQAVTIAEQSAQLRDSAVLEERLRIARELHDVVAHHVSAMGVQAGAARRLLPSDPERAMSALSHVEEGSREAVEQMRHLLGALRDTGHGTIPDRAGDPGVAQVPQLVDDAAQQGVAATYDVVERPVGALGAVPGPLGASVYRTVQEALTNVARHSTATSAQVVLRVDVEAASPFVEVEVLDQGRPRPSTSGSGLGQLGIRERAAAHRGAVEMGPRVTGGYRVRVRYPLEQV